MQRLHDIVFEWPETLALEHLTATLEEYLRVQRQRHKQEQLRIWQRRMTAFPQARRYVNYQVRQRLDAVRDEMGNLQHDLPAMDHALREYWQRQALPANGTVDQSRDTTRRRVLDMFWQQDYWTLPQVQVADMKDALTQMQRQTAPGPGGWHVAEIQMLPAVAVLAICLMPVSAMADIHVFSLRVTQHAFPNRLEQLIWVRCVLSVSHLCFGGGTRGLALSNSQAKCKPFSHRPSMELFRAGRRRM